MDDLKKIAPELSKLKKELPFEAPKNYFDDFSARLQMKIEAEKQVTTPGKIRFLEILKPALGLAASFAIIFMLVYVPLKTFIPSQPTEIAEQADYYEEESLLDYIEHIDETAFVAILNEAEEEDSFSDDDLALYVSANFSDYEIYAELDNK